MNAFKTVASLAAASLWMAGCSYAPVQLGMSRQDVIARYGSPSRIVPLSSGMRLQYSTQPAGRSVVMVDLDAGGFTEGLNQR